MALNWRIWIPATWRRDIRIRQRQLKDWLKGASYQFARKQHDSAAFSYAISLSQPIQPSSHFENKIHNLRLGIQEIEQVLVLPQQIFSFWQILPEPNAHNRYKLGRNLIGGKLSEDYGGGLCQLSSILYHLALKTGLEIIERHHHSFDIYEEHERFTPLGADATVVFGYKDLRLRNPYAFPIRFRFEILENTLTCTLESVSPISPLEIVFQREIKGDFVSVETRNILNKTSVVLATSVYRTKF